MTLYLVDADVIIRAHEDFYPVDRIPHFWMWLQGRAEAGTIKMVRANYDEVAPSRGLHAEWLRQPTIRDALVMGEPTDRARLQLVLDHGYGTLLTDLDLDTIGLDPFLIAAALGGPDRVVVTREFSAPSKQRQNRKVPDVCATFGVPCINDYALYRELAFSIEWPGAPGAGPLGHRREGA